MYERERVMIHAGRADALSLNILESRLDWASATATFL